MSENLDLVRSIYADWEDGDFSRTDWANPGLQVMFVDGPTPGTTQLDGMARRWGEVLDAWDDVRTEAFEFREIDDKRVFVHMRWSGRGRASGVDIAKTGSTGANVFHIDDGRVTRLMVYFSGRRALTDLGLEE